METMNQTTTPVLDDGDIIERVLKGEKNAYEFLMRKYNQRLFRITRSYLRDDDEVEDVIQETYVKAYEQLARFEGRAQFSTWLTRIAINEALARLNRKRRTTSAASMTKEGGEQSEIELQVSTNENPADQLMNTELRSILENAVDGLPAKYRSVYMMREIEGLSIAETSECLEISPVNVKVRLNRAKEMLRERISTVYQDAEIFQFNLVMCDRIVKNVLRRVTSY